MDADEVTKETTNYNRNAAMAVEYTVLIDFADEEGEASDTPGSDITSSKDSTD